MSRVKLFMRGCVQSNRPVADIYECAEEAFTHLFYRLSAV
jgi:hypothetical protein